VVDRLSDVVLILLADDTIAYETRSASRVLGYEPGALVGRNVLESVHPDDAEEARSSFDDARHGRSAGQVVEFRFRHAGGHWVNFEAQSESLPGEAEPAGIVVTCRDVTAHSEAERARAESEARYLALFESLSDAALVADVESGRILEANAQAEALLKLSRREIVGMHHSQLHPPEHEEYYRSVFGRLGSDGGGEALEGEVVRSDGQIAPVSIRGSAMHVGDRAVLLELFQDISARLEAQDALEQQEREMAAVFDSMVEHVVYQDLDHRVIWANRAAAESVGLEPGQLVGRTCHEVWNSAPGPCEGCPVDRARATGRPAEGEMATADGRTWQVKGYPVRSEGGEVVAMVELTAEISELKTAQDELKRQRQLLERAARLESVGKLAGGIAHDFNNLLTGIIGYSDLILRDMDRKNPLRQDVEEIKRAGARAAELTQQLLAFSRKQILDARVLDLNAVVDGMSKMLSRLIGENLELATHLSPDIGRVKADPAQIEQVIMNLVVNARDAMPDGGELTISTANEDLDEADPDLPPYIASGSFVRLTVQDTGAGIDDEVLDHIFEPFFTTKERGEGTGLGLATVYGIVKQHSGYVWAESAEGRGTLFKVYLPRVEARLQSDAPAEAVPRVPRGNERILVVEDEEAVRGLAERVLLSAGYEVFSAGSPDAALRLATEQGNGFELLLTDVVLPDRSGTALYRDLAKSRPALRVLYMSGYTDESVLQLRRPEAGVAFLPKPFTPEQLLRKVRDVLEEPAPRPQGSS
jgi:PAS domain S-box-containing protein